MIMRRPLPLLLKDTRGAAAAEMAMVTPLLVLLAFAPMELGNYFLSEHALSKAVRDGARFAGRQSFAAFPSCSTIDATTATNIKNIVRTGQITSGGNPRLIGWTSPATITVSVACNTGNSYSGAGIYTGKVGGAPVVTVGAVVPYQSLFQRIGFASASLSLRAQSQSAVMGT
jgi:Flp pilus assembly protein TadG